MGINNEDAIFLTLEEQELYMLHQLLLEYGESFHYKQGNESAIYEVHKQYSLRRKKNAEVPIKKSFQTQNKKIIEAPMTKILQILPR